jgi:hypothetical protein
LLATCVRASVSAVKDTLIVKFGGDVLISDLRHLVANCPRRDAAGKACGFYFAKLRGDG